MADEKPHEVQLRQLSGALTDLLSTVARTDMRVSLGDAAKINASVARGNDTLRAFGQWLTSERE